MFLLGVEVSEELGLERQPFGLELLEVAAIGAHHDRLERSVQAVMIAGEHASEGRQMLWGDHDCTASVGVSASAASENDGNSSWIRRA